MTIVLVAAWLGVTASAAIPIALGQEKTTASGGALDPRLNPLIGTWEGRAHPRGTFTTDRGNRMALQLVNQDGLSGTHTIGGRGSGSPERQIDLLRKK